MLTSNDMEKINQDGKILHLHTYFSIEFGIFLDGNSSGKKKSLEGGKWWVSSWRAQVESKVGGNLEEDWKRWLVASRQMGVILTG